MSKRHNRAKATGSVADERMVPVPVPKHLVPEVEKLLSRPAVSEGTVSVPSSVASSATDLVGKPGVLMNIVQKLMAGAKEGNPYKSDKDFVDDCVQAFLHCSASAIEQARGGATGFDGLPDQKATEAARRVYAALSRARLFCIRPERFLVTNQIADRFTTETLAGLDWKPYSGADETKEDSEKLVMTYMEHGKSWPFPDPLPFDSVFLCYGRRLELRNAGVSLWGRVSPEMMQQFDEPDVYLYGHLIWMEGDTPFSFTCIGIRTHGPTVASPEPKLFPPGFIETYSAGEWTQPMSLDPWIVNMLVKSINEHKVVNQSWTQTLSQRMDRKQLGKKHKTVLPLPEPFYLVPLKDELIEPPEYRSNAAVPKIVEWSHRWDVRGHEVVRVIRGQLPLSAEDAGKLKKRGYRLYLEGRITDPDDAGRILKRGVPGPGLNEWVGVLHYWRDSFVKGPEDKPYVPAARV